MNQSYEQLEELISRLRLQIDTACCHLDDMIEGKAFVKDGYGDYALKNVMQAKQILRNALQESELRLE